MMMRPVAYGVIWSLLMVPAGNAIAGQGPSVMSPESILKPEGRAGAIMIADPAERAVAQAEAAVRRMPDNAEARALLGNAYFRAGRFGSSERAYEDAVHLDSGNGKAGLGLALARVALGQRQRAVEGLQTIHSLLPAVDIGLALTLAGDHERAIILLEQAVRMPDASAMARQNLAFSYAMAGRWREALAMAGQDLSGRDLDRRIMDWAAIAHPRTSADQVTVVMGIRPAALDPGLPSGLALVRLAPQQPTQMAQPAGSDPVPVQSVHVTPVASVVKFSERAPIKRQYSLQIGAYLSHARLHRAWREALAKTPVLAGHVPQGSSVRGHHGQVIHRLSIGGFATMAAAWRLCRSVRARGTACYVRGQGEDTPLVTGRG